MIPSPPSASASKSKIHVGGDSYLAAFHLPAQSLKLKGWDTGSAHFLPLRAGADFVAEAIPLLRTETSGNCFLLHQSCFTREARLSRLFTLKQGNKVIPDFGKPGANLPFLRHEGNGERVSFPWHSIPAESAESKVEVTLNDVIVHWIGQPDIMPGIGSRSLSDHKPQNCGIHIQIGRMPTQAAATDNGGPSILASPNFARVIITSLSEICPDIRIRRTLSYESIIVDILRNWRDYDKSPGFATTADQSGGGSLQTLIGEDALQGGKGAPIHTFVAVRLNHAAVFLYRWTPSAKHPEGREAAWLFYHKALPAPLAAPGLGRMEGFNGFVGAYAAAEARALLAKGPAAGGTSEKWLVEAIRQSMLTQCAHHAMGLFHFFFSYQKQTEKWSPVTSERLPERQQHFAYLEEWIERAEWKPQSSVQEVRIKIDHAVSHRTAWFIAQNVPLEKSDDPAQVDIPTNSRPDFLKIAKKWLTAPEGPEPKQDIPIVSIDKLQLVDRREVEDFLALHKAFSNYGETKNHKRPLNISVFGPPGSGKSFGVSAVAAYIAKNTSHFSDEILTFNVSQFTRLEDLCTALHKVRDECLKGKIPVVFMDEFDSSFEGRPFGWLKYFLAPMQDGAFTDMGKTYKLGNCVLVFAGGVNRSFEEFNGRLRNPSFVEAKGPDFISRLRSHLNIRGINKPEDEADQGRYILRRAVMLHYQLRERLCHTHTNAAPAAGLAHSVVADAFLEVEHFKHGARSMEAILDMCDLERGRQIGPSDLPAKSQLDMHVDAAEFLRHVYPEAMRAKSPAAH